MKRRIFCWLLLCVYTILLFSGVVFADDCSECAVICKHCAEEKREITPYTQSKYAEDYRTWAQADSRWGSLPVGDCGDTVSSIGCCVSSVAKLIIQCGLKDTGTFNIGTLVTWLNNNSGFTNEGALYWEKPSSMVSGFSNHGDILGYGSYSSSGYNEQILAWIRQGLHMTINVNGGGHWIAVDEAKSLETGQVYIMDSLSGVQNADITLDSRYSSFVTIHAYTGGSTDIDWSTWNKITLDPCGGACSTSYIYAKYDHLCSEYMDLPVPTRFGYRFGGWYSEKNGKGSKYTNDIKFWGYEDVTWYAYWILDGNIITLDPCGGTCSLDFIIAKYGYLYSEYCELPTPIRFGYKFGGWYSEKDGNGSKYTGDMKFWGYEDVTWYANWIHTEHTYVAEVIKPTCTEQGFTTHTCSCGDSYKDTYINALGHAWNAGTVTTQPTCVEQGVRSYRCTVCSASKTEAISATGHNEVLGKAVAPTCTQNGLTAGSHCSVCNEVLVAQEAVAELGHNWNEGTVTAAPTATEKGEMTFTCSRCNETRTEEIPETGEVILPFTDVPEGKWFTDAVKFAYAKELFGGTSATEFSPDGNMTRGMLVTVLWRLDGKPTPEGENTFNDVEAGKYYAAAVTWAAESGVVGGVGNGKFNPDGNVTREQIAAIMFRYAAFKGYSTEKSADLSGFPDSGKVSSWAKTALAWANAEELIGGTVQNGATVLDPQGNATRAQVATILMRYVNNIVNK